MSSSELLSIAGLCAIAYGGARLLGPAINKYEKASRAAALQEQQIAYNYYKGYSDVEPITKFTKGDAKYLTSGGLHYV